MKKSIIGFVLLTIMLFSLSIEVFASGEISFNIDYNIIGREKQVQLSVSFEIENATTKENSFVCVAVLYDSEQSMQSFDLAEIVITGGETESAEVSLYLPDNGEEYYAKCFVLENLNSIKTLGDIRFVYDLELYEREKYIFVTTDANDTFNVFMNSENIKAVSGITHTLRYNPKKFKIDDLCGLTLEKENAPCQIDDIIIRSVDTVYGEIVFEFLNCNSGRLTGINNIVKFTAITEVENEKITYLVK